jgi:thiamine biosynthesis lipoprotein
MALSWWRLQPTDEAVRRTQLLMGTVVEIVAQGEQANEAIDAAFAEMARLEKLLSRHVEDSDVRRLSRSDKGGKVATETAEVINLGLDVAQKSQGAFDLTLGELKSLWKMDTEEPVVPTQNELSNALRGIGPQALQLKTEHVTKQQPQLQVDLGGIAKGYIVDQAIGILQHRGITSAAVNAGGDMYLLGRKIERPWRIGIQHPRNSQDILTTVSVSDRAVVTSGDYERFFEIDGVRYHHIFDPKSGLPSRLCRSVTIITENVALGDALATAIFVLGPQAGLKLLKEYPQSEALIMAADGSLHKSPGWEKYEVTP